MDIEKLIEEVEKSNAARDELRKIRDRINDVLNESRPDYLAPDTQGDFPGGIYATAGANTYKYAGFTNDPKVTWEPVLTGN